MIRLHDFAFETTYPLRAVERLEQCNDSIRHTNKEANENPLSKSKENQEQEKSEVENKNQEQITELRKQETN